jgi:hypothetical protein
MTPLFPAQRAAEEFDQALGGTATHAVAERYAELLDTVVLLRAQPEVAPRADFVEDLRSRLMTAAETELVGAPAVVRQLPQTQPHTRPSRNRRRLATVAASLVIVGGSAGMAAAASGALPGESLYPVKRGVEQVTAAVQLSDAGKGRALLDQAATRLDEVRDLQAQSDPDEALIARTVDSFRSTADEGSDKLFRAYQADGDTGDITTVRTFAAEQMTDLAGMAGARQAGLDSVLVDAADTVADIDQQARVLCGACAPQSALSPPQALSAGAGALAVQNLLSRPVAQAATDIAQAEAVDQESVSRLTRAAQESAGNLPQASGASGATSDPTLPTVPTDKDAVTSTMTEDGDLVPTIQTGKAAVKGLVSGVTTSVSGVTSTIVPPKTPLGEAVKGVTDTVDDTLNGLLPDN